MIKTMKLCISMLLLTKTNTMNTWWFNTAWLITTYAFLCHSLTLSRMHLKSDQS